MGIVEQVLTEFELTDGTEYRIEYNEDGSIHMHVDNFRIVFSTEEFRRFVQTIDDGQTSLRELKQDDD